MKGSVVQLAPTRPVLRYHGGKWKLAPWIISHFPEHRVYDEPYGGAASVLVRKERAYAEVYNDLHDEVVTLFQVLRSGRKRELVEALRLTPFARTEFEASYDNADDAVEISRRLIVRSFMGFGSDGFNKSVKTGFRSDSNRSGTTPARDWMNYPNALETIIERLRGVVVENANALDVMRRYDAVDCLHYVDPPYVHHTRSPKQKGGQKYHAYEHEMTDADHAEMLDTLLGLEGMVVLSGYPNALYDDALNGWMRVERAALADGARARTEVLWINPAAADRQPQPSLF